VPAAAVSPLPRPRGTLGALGGPERLLGGLLRLLQLTESIQTPQKPAAGRGCDLAVIGWDRWLRLGLQLGFCLDFRGFSWLRLVAAVRGEQRGPRDAGFSERFSIFVCRAGGL
jgi:hypothetical protein